MFGLLGSTLLAIVSSISFGILTNVPRRALLPSAFTGGMAWASYYLASQIVSGIIFPNIIGGFCVGYFSNYFARKSRTPITMIYVGSLISLVPGGLAFTSVQLLGENNTLATINGGINVILLAVSLTLGLGLSTIITGGIPKLYSTKTKN